MELTVHTQSFHIPPWLHFDTRNENKKKKKEKKKQNEKMKKEEEETEKKTIRGK